jgi:hypothetical protein
MKHIMTAAVAVAALTIAAPAQADFIGQSSGTITNAMLLYEGFGELTPGSGIGTGRWTQGLCNIVSGNTVCGMSGTYTDSAGGDGTPGAGGSFIFNMSYSGTGDAPTRARSATPGNDSLYFIDTGDAIFSLVLSPLGGGSITSIFPDMPFANSLGFGLFYQPGAVCAGLAAGKTCGPGEVGLTPGSSILGAVSLSFRIPTKGAVVVPPAAVPEPAALSLMALGIGLMALRRYGRVRKTK